MTLPDWTVGLAYDQTDRRDRAARSPYLTRVSAGSSADRPEPQSQHRRNHRHPDRLRGQPVHLHHHCSPTPTATPAARLTPSPSTRRRASPRRRLPSGTVGQAYNQTIGETGGTGSLAFSRVVRAACRRASASTPAPAPSPARRPTATDSPFSFTITATDSVGATGSQAYSVTIASSSTPITIVSRTVNGDLLNVTSSISSAVETAEHQVQITTSSADGFYVGELVSITGVGTAEFNGTYTVASVIDSTDFTYTDGTSMRAAPAASATAALPSMPWAELSGRWSIPSPMCSTRP